MKKHLSVIGLFCRTTLYRLLGLSVLAIVAEVILFTQALKNNPDLGIELLIENSRVPFVFAAWFLLFTFILVLPGCDFKSRSVYTFRRLRISERAVFVCQAIYNMACYIMLLCMQIVTAYGLCVLYTHLAPAELLSGHTVFLAFYRSDFLHSILPLQEGMRWGLMAIAILSMGICTANFPFMNRRGSFGMTTVANTVIVMGFYVRELGYFGLLPLVTFLTMGIALFNVFTWEEEDEVYENGAAI
ncbi:MAG: hypothetical protein IKT81_00675 [Clostridia bacterium]|nr:hypothetical protein [Clostridia bacterium]